MHFPVQALCAQKLSYLSKGLKRRLDQITFVHLHMHAGIMYKKRAI